MMHFLKAGRELISPLAMEEALCQAIYGRPSADTDVWVNDKGEIKLESPWGSADEAELKMQEWRHASGALHGNLMRGSLRTYAMNPTSGEYLQIPRLYWFRRDLVGEQVLGAVDAATGWDASMEGQPILVAHEDIGAWQLTARQALSAQAFPVPSKPRTYTPRDRVLERKLARFIARDAKRHMPDGEEPLKYPELYEHFQRLCRDNKVGSTPKPITGHSLSWFKKWVKRFYDGTWRPLATE